MTVLCRDACYVLLKNGANGGGSRNRPIAPTAPCERQPQILRTALMQGMEHYHPLPGEDRKFPVYTYQVLEAFLTRGYSYNSGNGKFFSANDARVIEH